MNLKLHHEYQGTVTRVPDGDGLEVAGAFVTLRLRLRHIDAPEHGQPYARDAKRYLQSLCLNKLVTFRIAKWDNYGRAIADVSTQHHPDLAYTLIDAGLAWWYRRFSRTTHYARAEKRAQDTRKGLWKDPNPTPPWEYRNAKKLRSQKQR